MLVLNQVKKTYGTNLILDIPSLTLSPGLYWLQGENGSGKSSFMKLLAGLVPFTGDSSSNGVSIRKQATAYRQLIHYTEAEPIYPPYLRGIDLLHFHQKTRQASDQQVQTLTDAFRIREFVDKPVGTYSSGMVKRLSLVLLFLGKPAILLLDEPLVTLDVQSQHQILQAITAAVQANQMVIFTSHQPPDARALPPYSILYIQNKAVCFG